MVKIVYFRVIFTKMMKNFIESSFDYIMKLNANLLSDYFFNIIILFIILN